MDYRNILVGEKTVHKLSLSVQPGCFPE